MLLQAPNLKTEFISPRVNWYQSHKKLTVVMGLLYLLITLTLSANLSLKQLLFYLHLSLVVLLYGPILKFIHIPLRTIPYIKPFLISYVWAMVTSYMSIKDSQSSMWYLLEAFTYIWCLSNVFDIRDITFDQKNNVKTLAGSWGYKKSKIILAVIFSINAISHYFLFPHTIWKPIFLCASFFFVLTKIRDQSPDLYLILGADSLMLLKLIYLI